MRLIPGRKVSIVFLLLLVFLPVGFPQSIPEELQKLGFIQKNLLNYERDGSVEYFTFFDHRTEEAADIVTVLVENGAIQEFFEGVIHKAIGE